MEEMARIDKKEMKAIQETLKLWNRQTIYCRCLYACIMSYCENGFCSWKAECCADLVHALHSKHIPFQCNACMSVSMKSKNHVTCFSHYVELWGSCADRSVQAAASQSPAVALAFVSVLLLWGMSPGSRRHFTVTRRPRILSLVSLASFRPSDPISN